MSGRGRQRGVSTILVLAAILLVAALLFGVWHVVVGGLVHGNPRAATFGGVLSVAAAGLLVITTVVGRRARRA